jgi:hypothetical protein
MGYVWLHNSPHRRILRVAMVESWAADNGAWPAYLDDVVFTRFVQSVISGHELTIQHNENIAAACTTQFQDVKLFLLN